MSLSGYILRVTKFFNKEIQILGRPKSEVDENLGSMLYYYSFWDRIPNLECSTSIFDLRVLYEALENVLMRLCAKILSTFIEFIIKYQLIH